MRFVKVVFSILVVAAALVGGLVLGLRVTRSKVSALGELRPGIFGVTNGMGITVFAARTAPGPHVIVFDTGLDPAGHPVDALLGALGASRDDVSDLFLTHAHGDHTAGAPLLSKAKVHLGAGDVPLATGKVEPEAMLPRLMAKALQTAPIAVNAPMTGAATLPVGLPGATPADAKVVKAYPVPGHTPGSYAFLYDGVLFTGDIMILKQGRLELPAAVFDPRPEENKASIRSLKTQLKDETVDVVCTAHGGCTPKGLGRNLLEELISRI